MQNQRTSDFWAGVRFAALYIEQFYNRDCGDPVPYCYAANQLADRLKALLAQRIEHEPSKLGVEGSTGAERDLISGLAEKGLVIVPAEPSEAMLAAALPLSVNEPSYDDKRLGARACMLLSGSLKIPNEGSAVLAAAQLAQDYRAMVAASNGRA